MSSQNHLFLPLLVPLLGAGAAMLLQRWRRALHGLVLLVALGNLGYAGWLLQHIDQTGRQVVQVGNWGVPNGIMLVADSLSALFLFLTALVLIATLLLAFVSLDRQREAFSFYPLLLLLILGANGAFVAGDLFNLYVWGEVLLLAALALVSLGGSRRQLGGSLSFLMLNLLCSIGVLIGCGLIYGLVNTFNMALMSERLNELAPLHSPGIATVIAGIFLIAYGGRAALFPLFFWLSSSYHTPPIAISVVLGGLLTNVGFYALVRIFSLLYPHTLVHLAPVMMLIASLTMVVGVLGAIAQTHIRRMLAFLLVSQGGFILMGLSLASEAGIAASLLFLAHHVLALAAFFCMGGLVEYLFETDDIQQMGGLAQREPLLAGLWFLGFVALVGLPPLGGFFARLSLLQTSLEQDSYGLAAVASLVNLLYLLPLLALWHEVFWKPRPLESPPPDRMTIGQFVPVTLLVGMLLVFALAIGPIARFSVQSAQQALDSAGYIEAVLNRGPTVTLPEAP